jgi:hypothetical protein
MCLRLIAIWLTLLSVIAQTPVLSQRSFPFTAEEDVDGARFVWFILNQQGYARDYEPCEKIPESKHYREITDPRPGDIIWWPKFMAFYNPSATDEHQVLAAGRYMSLKALVAAYGRPRFFRVLAEKK